MCKYKLHNSTRCTSSKKGCPQWHIYICIPYISGTFSNTGVHRHKTEPVFIPNWTQSLDLETGYYYSALLMVYCWHTYFYNYKLTTSKTQWQTLNGVHSESHFSTVTVHVWAHSETCTCAHIERKGERERETLERELVLPVPCPKHWVTLL